MSNISPHHWLHPWRAITQGEAPAFEAELGREIGPGHALEGVHAMAIARRDDCDDVLYALFGHARSLAVVHLTWSGQKETTPALPSVELFESWEAWAERGMRVDAGA